MLFIKLIESLSNTKLFFFDILKLLITKNSSIKYRNLIEYFSQNLGGVCITASGNILASGNLCFRVFKLKSN